MRIRATQQDQKLHNWQSEIQKQLLIFVLVCAIGFLVGQLLWAVVLLLGFYCARTYQQLYRLNKWLAQDPDTRPTEPPESVGLWGNIYDGIYQMQKQEQLSKGHLQNIINKAQESSAVLEMAVVMINSSDSLEWWNRAAEKLLGFRFPQDQKQSVTNLVRDPKFAEYYNSQNYNETLKLAAPGDNRKILEFQIALFGEQERLMIVRDITQLERLSSMRKDFVANVSHELGTPITVIKGYLEAILDNSDSLDKRWHKPIEQMRQQSMRMENMVRDLLMLSSLETKTMPKNRKAVDVKSLISEIESDTRQMFTDKSHSFVKQCDDNAIIMGKRNELYSAISNLVVNAAKYTPANGTIELKTYRDTDNYYIEVKDNGIGIEAHHLPRLTERFYRVDGSRASDSGGTGLGLAIAKHILLRHDGELLIESEYGKGSRFICAISLERVRPVETIEPDNEEAEAVH